MANTQSKEVNLTKRVQTIKGMRYCPNPDLAVVNDFDNTVTLLLGKGDGTFPTLSTPLRPYCAGGTARAVSLPRSPTILSGIP